VPADPSDHVGIVARVGGGDAPRPVPQLATGARHQHRVNPFGGAAGQQSPGEQGLVVGVGMNRHQRELPGHRSRVCRPGAPERRVGVP